MKDERVSQCNLTPAIFRYGTQSSADVTTCAAKIFFVKNEKSVQSRLSCPREENSRSRISFFNSIQGFQKLEVV